MANTYTVLDFEGVLKPKRALPPVDEFRFCDWTFDGALLLDSLTGLLICKEKDA